MPSIARSNWVRLPFLFLILSVTSACVTDSIGRVPVNSYCAVARPISYDGIKDTPETVKLVEAHNSQWVCLCEQDCPARP